MAAAKETSVDTRRGRRVLLALLAFAALAFFTVLALLYLRRAGAACTARRISRFHVET